MPGLCVAPVHVSALRQRHAAEKHELRGLHGRDGDALHLVGLRLQALAVDHGVSHVEQRALLPGLGAAGHGVHAHLHALEERHAARGAGAHVQLHEEEGRELGNLRADFEAAELAYDELGFHFADGGDGFARDGNAGVGVGVVEARIALLLRLGQRHPALYAVELVRRAGRLLLEEGQAVLAALAVHHALAGHHEVHLPGQDGQLRAGGVAVQDAAVEEVGQCGHADVRVRPHVHGRLSREHLRPEVVEEAEGAHEALLARGHEPPHGERRGFLGLAREDLRLGLEVDAEPRVLAAHLLPARRRRLLEGRLDDVAAAQRLVHRALVGDRAQLLLVLRRQLGPVQQHDAVDEVDLLLLAVAAAARAVAVALRGAALAVLAVDLGVVQDHVHALQRDVPALCVHPQGDGGAGAERAQEQIVRVRTLVGAAQRHRLVGQNLVLPDLALVVVEGLRG
mmetsp:Transcript_41620/g.130424  ORF Transcript_41620/g.130424 Transcript_41620/m.130424 type:complete len:453 (-) Transcript_41620:174-1532(-)